MCMCIYVCMCLLVFSSVLCRSTSHPSVHPLSRPAPAYLHVRLRLLCPHLLSFPSPFPRCCSSSSFPFSFRFFFVFCVVVVLMYSGVHVGAAGPSPAPLIELGRCGHWVLEHDDKVDMRAQPAASGVPKSISRFTDLATGFRCQTNISRNHGTRCDARRQEVVDGDCPTRKNRDAALTRRRENMLAPLFMVICPHLGVPTPTGDWPRQDRAQMVCCLLLCGRIVVPPHLRQSLRPRLCLL